MKEQIPAFSGVILANADELENDCRNLSGGETGFDWGSNIGMSRYGAFAKEKTSSFREKTVKDI